MDIHTHPLLRLFPEPLAGELLGAVTPQALRAGEVVFEEGDPPEHLYLVLSGEFDILKRAPGGPPTRLATLDEGEIFGELGVLDGGSRSGRAVCRTDGELAAIARGTFLDVLHRAPVETALAIGARVGRSLRATDSLFVQDLLRREKLQVVGEMANKVIHDFKGPFTAISLAVDMIRRQHRDPSTVRYCQILSRNLLQMEGMMREILDFSAGGQVRVEQERVSLPKLFEDLRTDYGGVLSARAVDLFISHNEAVVIGDSRRLLRVFQNLLGNAIDAFSAATGNRVEFRATRVGDRVVVVVTDNGPGIPPGLGESIFEPFVTAGKAGGTGLGLSIVKTVVEAHGGTIRCENDPAGGAIFTLDLPAAP